MRTMLALATVCSVGPLRAAVPTHGAAIAVSATVLPGCNHTGCRDIPRVMHYRRAGEPAFGLAQAGDPPVLTITY